MLPLDLSNLAAVKTFAQQALENVGQDKIDYLLLNAATFKGAGDEASHGSRWCEAAVVNHFCTFKRRITRNIPERVMKQTCEATNGWTNRHMTG